MLSHINREKITLKNPSQACCDNGYFRGYSHVCCRSSDAFYHIGTNQSGTIGHPTCLSYVYSVGFTGPKEVGLCKVFFLFSSNVQCLVKTRELYHVI